MKIKLLIPFTFFVFLNGNAQQKDTIYSINKTDKLSYTHFILPATLITSGIVLKNALLNKNLQGNFRTILGTDLQPIQINDPSIIIVLAIKDPADALYT